MSNRGGGKRPTKLVNLSRDDDWNTSPVNIPRQSRQQNHPGAQSAPSGRGVVPRQGSSLLAPVIDDADVISSSLRSDTSTMERRKEAASGGLGAFKHHVQNYGGMEGGVGPRGGSPDLDQSHEIEEDYVKIASRHKRAEHATSYVYLIAKGQLIPAQVGKTAPQFLCFCDSTECCYVVMKIGYKLCIYRDP